MKIKNFINIKVNGKSIDFHNLILDEYLKKFVDLQLDIANVTAVRRRRKLSYCFLKFDTPLNFQADSTINNSDFDVCLVFGLQEYNESVSERQIVEKYRYSLQDSRIWDYSMQSWNEDLTQYYNRNITAIGFNTSFSTGSIYTPPVCAILDTSNYNISLMENEGFELTRIDTILSDANFWAKDNRIKGPIHLTAEGGSSLLYQDPLYEEEGDYSSYVEAQPTYSQLYSVGFSSYKDFIAEEYVLGTDITAVNNGTSISIDGLQTKMKQYTYYPLQSIFPFSGLFPLKPSYKYVLFKYKLFQKIYTRNPDYIEGGDEDKYIETWTDTGVYYLQSVPLNKYGKTDLTIKYERGN